MKEDIKSKNWWIIIIIIILLVMLGYLIYYKKDVNDKLKHHLENGYTQLDLSDMEKLNSLAKKIDSAESNNEITYIPELGADPVKFMFMTENESAYFEYEGIQYYIEIDNVKKILSYNFSCGMNTDDFYILDNNGDVYHVNIADYENNDMVTVLTLLTQNFKKINNVQTYDNIYLISTFASTCGSSSELIGVKDNEEYYVSSETNFDGFPYAMNLVMNDENCNIKTDRVVNCENLTGIHNKKISEYFSSSSDGVKDIIITEDKKIYEVSPYEKTAVDLSEDAIIKYAVYKQLNNEKVELIVGLENKKEYTFKEVTPQLK